MKLSVKKANFWVRRRSSIPVLLIGSLVVLLLVLNEDTSISLNMEYERQINEIKAEIKLNKDSAAFYRSRRESILQGTADLEYLAREQYHMQRPTEDVYIIRR
ncbi:MAG: hypothetical protein HDS82_03295 [Bacteroidales bacterium]|nr:hypothetical protein [Bacteroidales bacterium]